MGPLSHIELNFHRQFGTAVSLIASQDDHQTEIAIKGTAIKDHQSKIAIKGVATKDHQTKVVIEGTATKDHQIQIDIWGTEQHVH